MARDEPRLGQLYSCAEQNKMHGGDIQSTLPDSDGRVTLIRFRRDKNPNGPLIIDHGGGSSGPASAVHRRVRLLRRQGGSLPIYRYAGWRLRTRCRRRFCSVLLFLFTHLPRADFLGRTVNSLSQRPKLRFLWKLV